MTWQPEPVADYACICGENPLWHPQKQCVYWVDIPRGRLFRYYPATGRHEPCLEAPAAIGGFTIQADGALLLFMARGAVCCWRAGQLVTVIPEIPDERATRFNDVIADPAGRVFCGTMPTPSRPGRLYRLDPDGTLTRLLDDVRCSNGLGFTPDRRQLYHTDTRTHTIFRFDYDPATGAIANRQPFVTDPATAAGGPDGLTVDAVGDVWSARWDGACLVRYSPAGEELQRVPFPVQKVSSVTFGGPAYDELYVTTAGGDRRATDGPLAGALFRLRPGLRGVPEFVSRIRVPPAG